VLENQRTHATYVGIIVIVGNPNGLSKRKRSVNIKSRTLRLASCFSPLPIDCATPRQLYAATNSQSPSIHRKLSFFTPLTCLISNTGYIVSQPKLPHFRTEQQIAHHVDTPSGGATRSRSSGETQRRSCLFKSSRATSCRGRRCHFTRCCTS